MKSTQDYCEDWCCLAVSDLPLLENYMVFLQNYIMILKLSSDSKAKTQLKKAEKAYKECLEFNNLYRDFYDVIEEFLMKLKDDYGIKIKVPSFDTSFSVVRKWIPKDGTVQEVYKLFPLYYFIDKWYSIKNTFTFNNIVASLPEDSNIDEMKEDVKNKIENVDSKSRKILSKTKPKFFIFTKKIFEYTSNEEVLDAFRKEYGV